jgi:hypothetical protein
MTNNVKLVRDLTFKTTMPSKIYIRNLIIVARTCLGRTLPLSPYFPTQLSTTLIKIDPS